MTERRIRESRRRGRRARRAAVATGVTVAVAVTGAGAALAAGAFDGRLVGSTYAQGVLLADNQYVKPYGTRTLIRDGRLLSSALSPDGTSLAALSWENFSGFLSIFDARTGTRRQQLLAPAVGTTPPGDGSVAADGPFWSHDGRTLWVPQTADLLKFAVAADGTVAATPTVIPLTGPNGPALPSGMAESPDGTTLYIALNGSNALGVLDEATNTLTASVPTGVAPRQVVLVGTSAFVSNEGGRVPGPHDVTNLTDFTPVVSDPSTGAVTNGTLSVVDVATKAVTDTIRVGLEPTALHLGPDGTLFVANSNDDSISLVDTASHAVLQTVNVNPLPGSTVGSYPNAFATPDATHVLVSVGRDNAVEVFGYSGARSPMTLKGLIPTDQYPVGVVTDPATHQVIVTNDKGIGALGGRTTLGKGPFTHPATGHNTYNDTGSLTRFAMPADSQLNSLTQQVFTNNNWNRLAAGAARPVSTGAAPVPVPVHLGDPSTIKHVFLIVKENRTYDQVLGDAGRGNGDPSLTQFGGSVTPNQHKLAARFGLFDNAYDPGTLSADGHNWLVQADANDYIEKEFGAFYRSYPAQGGDALAYQRDGFLWNAVAAVGQTAKAYGEYANFFTAPAPSAGGPTWQQWYRDSQILEGKASGPLPIPVDKYRTYSDIPSLNAILDPSYPRFDLNVPDQYRADIFLQSLKATPAANVANLTTLWLPDDHTSAVGSGVPYPVAQVADNDLALGRIVDGISHSAIWPSSAIFVVEDDTQNGVDHVDGHRGPLQVISPYSARGVVNSTYYTQLNVVKTIEQILGVPPMNQEDRAATPMTDAFTTTPDVAPYTVAPNQVPLTAGLPGSPAAGGASAAAASGTPAGVPAAARATYAAWMAWSATQRFGTTVPDAVNPRLLNRLDWYASTNWSQPYPGDPAILAPSQVPGFRVPASYLGD